MTQNNVTTTYTYDANNRLLKETVAGIATTYAYDANGNMISALKGGNAAGAYTYNLFGNQVSFTADDSVFTYYTYRPDGLRHSIDDKVHVWDGANIVADIDGNNVSVYIRGINLIYADDGDKTYYHFNAHGDVVALTNANGSKTKSYSYNAFGVEYNEATLDDNPFRYCGEYYDKETKTIYLRARYYNAAQGRFTQEDPIRDGYNWYAYCGGNSVNCIDPTGYAVASCFGDIPDLLGGNDVLAYGLCGGGGSTNSYGYASEPTIPEFIGEPLEDIAVSGISTGAFVMAGITATADGPFPIGDVIGGIIVGIALAVTGSAIGYGEVNGSSIDINLEFKEIDLTKIAKKYIFYQCLKAAKEMLKKIII